MQTNRPRLRKLALLLILGVLCADPAWALRSLQPAENPLGQAGLEEQVRRSVDYSPSEVAGRLLDALWEIPSLQDQPFYRTEEHEIVLNPDQAAELLGHQPTASGLKRV